MSQETQRPDACDQQRLKQLLSYDWDELNDWERSFITSLETQHYSWTPKQAEKFDTIVENLERRDSASDLIGEIYDSP